jgi:hypothetical protein
MFDRDLEDLSADISDLLSFLVESESRKNIVPLMNTTLSILNAISQGTAFIESYLHRNAASECLLGKMSASDHDQQESFGMPNFCN